MSERNIQSEKMAACEKVATSIVHEFNNILATITYSAELASYDVPEDSPAYKDLERVLQTGNEAGEFISSIMSFCKPAKSDFLRFDITDFLFTILEDIRNDLPDNIVLITKKQSDELYLNADLNQIKFVITEIISNAVRSINMSAGEISVSIAEFNETKSAKISISNNGPGIPEENIEKIFDPFFTTRKHDAKGLGLATVYSYIQNSSGTISVKSGTDGKTVFDIYLPVDEK